LFFVPMTDLFSAMGPASFSTRREERKRELP